MSCIGLTILIFIVGLLISGLGHYIYDNAGIFEDIKEKIGLIILIIGVFIGIVSFSILLGLISMNLLLPVTEREFKVEYNSVKEMQTLSTDLRDASYTKELLEINKKINEAREFCNDPFWGCINSKEIASYDLLEKE